MALRSTAPAMRAASATVVALLSGAMAARTVRRFFCLAACVTGFSEWLSPAQSRF
jgi:hypothetical protein